MKYTVKLTTNTDNKYRPESLEINGEIATMSNYAAKYGYNWSTSAYGNILYYRTESGKNYHFTQCKIPYTESI